MSQLQIKDLWVQVDGVTILKGINLTLNTNEFHVIMGPNGNGKSTLLATLMGHYKYQVIKGEILFDGEDVLAMSVDQRSRKGLFLAMQYPSEITGVTNAEFIKTAVTSRLPEGEHLSLFKFVKELNKAASDLKMDEDLPQRYINVGFSGGEKKRNEILQLKMLKPTFAFLDEIDSGLDVDALRIVGENLAQLKSPTFGALIVTHYQRLLNYLVPDHVHILMDGKIVKSGQNELITKIENDGYDWLRIELGIGLDFEPRTVTPLGTCAVNQSFKGNKDE